MFAIERACQWAVEKNIKSIYIFSDSKSALTELLNAYSHNHFAVAVFKHLHTAKTRNLNIQFAWVRAHIGIPGNEIADAAAKSAALSQKSPDFSHTPISYIKQQCRLRLADSSIKYYEQLNENNYTKKLLSSYQNVNKFLSVVKPSFEITQFLTNHAFHKSYLHRFHITNSEHCPCTNSHPQTFKHLIFECSKFQPTRQTFLVACQQESLDPFDPEFLSEVVQRPDALCKFVNHINFIVNGLKDFNDS